MKEPGRETRLDCLDRRERDALVPGPGYSQEGERLAELYGFQPLEIYKLDDRISNLRAGDLDGDGVADLAVVNNGRSRIDLLLSKPAAEGEAAAAAGR